jgi:hypothetical protein
MLRFLLNFYWWPIFGLFAAGATIGDVATGGDGGGADSGDGGASGDDSTADGGGDSDATDGAGDGAEDASADGSSDDAATDDGAAHEDLEAPVDLGDGRRVPLKWKKLFDQAQKAGLGKEAKQLYFAQQRLAKAIPGGINAAIELAQSVEELGGVEGIEQMRDELEIYHADAGDFESNPAKWIETSFKENSDASLKAFTHALDFVADKHPEHYDHLMAKVIVNDLANVDVRAIYQALASQKDNADAQRLAKELAEYYNSRLDTSKKAPENQPDVKTKELTEREKQVERREMNTRFTEVNREALPALRSYVTKALTAEAKAAGIDLQKLAKEYPGEWRDLLNDIHQRIMKAATKDERFLEKYYALVKKGDLKRAAQAINQKHERIIQSSDVIKEAIADRGLFRKKGGAAASGKKGATSGSGAGGNSNANQNQGFQQVSARPANSAIDWSKTTTAMQLDGKYILKDGKKVIVKY